MLAKGVIVIVVQKNQNLFKNPLEMESENHTGISVFQSTYIIRLT